MLSNGAEQLLIIFLSALVALFLANHYEERNTKEQITQVLDVAEEQVTDRLSFYHENVMAVLSDKDKDDFEANGSLYAEYMINLSNTAFSYYKLDVDLSAFLLDTSVLVHIEPRTASLISIRETKLKNTEEDYFKRINNNEPTYDTTKTLLLNQMHHLAWLINYIEYEKKYTAGQTKDGAPTALDYLPEKSRQDYQDLITILNLFSDEDFSQYDESVYKHSNTVDFFGSRD